MRHRHHRFLLAPPGRQPPVERLKERVTLLDRRLGGLDQRGAQVAVALADPAALALAGAFVLSWRQLSPTRRMPGTRKATHINAQFSDDRFCYPLPDPWDGITERACGHPTCAACFVHHIFWPAALAGITCRRIWIALLPSHVDGCFHRPVEGGDLLVEEVEVAQMLSDHKGVMRSKRTTQCLLQLTSLGPQTPFGQLRQCSHIGGPRYKRLQHGPRRHASHVG